MPNKPQASRPKAPLSQRAGRATTKATMGLAFLVGRTAARVTKGFAEGVVEAGREIKRGYDEAT